VVEVVLSCNEEGSWEVVYFLVALELFYSRLKRMKEMKKGIYFKVFLIFPQKQVQF